jgi:hypothetical protein
MMPAGIEPRPGGNATRARTTGRVAARKGPREQGVRGAAAVGAAMPSNYFRLIKPNHWTVEVSSLEDNDASQALGASVACGLMDQPAELQPFAVIAFHGPYGRSWILFIRPESGPPKPFGPYLPEDAVELARLVRENAEAQFRQRGNRALSDEDFEAIFNAVHGVYFTSK